MKESRFDIFKKDIIASLDAYEKTIFSFHDLVQFFESNRASWKLPSRMSAQKFIELLLSKTKLKVYRFEFPYMKIIRYSWGDVPIYSLVSTLKEKSYFTHYSAMFIHGLTDQIPKAIYINFEQPKKSLSKGRLIQSSIDRAFMNRQRETKNVAIFEGYRVHLLNGQNTNRLGVINMSFADEKIEVTNIERTLIDIVVRPSYSGGVFEILDAFRKAVDRVSINKLVAMLKQINFIYPYHQAIGFYLERAGVYRDAQINLLQNFDIKYNFYLMHNMKDMDFSEKWKLYFPKGL